MKTVLVTGGAGFIGSNFLLYLARKYPAYRLINLDKLTYAGNLENLKEIEGRENYRFIRGDIADSAVVGKVFAGEEIDWVVNFAAESHVDRSILMPALFVRTNIMGTTNLLNAALNHWEGDWEEKRFLQISTDEVYGSLGETGYFTEKTPLDPHTPYAASKAGADLIVKAYHDTYGLPVIISRCTNNYGPYQFPEKLIPLVINNALHRKKLPVYGDGRQVRDWLYVEDHCQALDLILHRGKPGEVYNIGGHNERTNLSVVQTVISYLREHVDPGITEDLIAFVPDRKGHDFRYGIDPAKICNELGWRPETPFAEGIVRTIRWYLEHRDWLERVTAGEYQEYYRRVYGGR